MPHMHYMLPPAGRLIGASLDRYIRDQLYWVLHAPRQTGKTTFLQSWMREINSGTEAIACYVSVERCQGVPEAEIAIPAICGAIRDSAGDFKVPIPSSSEALPQSMLSSLMKNWAAVCETRKLIVLFDADGHRHTHCPAHRRDWPGIRRGCAGADHPLRRQDRGRQPASGDLRPPPRIPRQTLGGTPRPRGAHHRRRQTGRRRLVLKIPTPATRHPTRDTRHPSPAPRDTRHAPPATPFLPTAVGGRLYL